MIGEYLSFANKCVQKFKPVIEDITGTKLEGIIVKNSSEYPAFDANPDYFHDTLMFVNDNYPDTIFINEKNYKEKGKSVSSIPVGINHELSHIVHRKLFEKFILENVRKNNIRADITGLLERWRKSISFREGFAEYISLDCLLRLYNHDELKEVISDKNSVSHYWNNPQKSDMPYERGYKFFKKALSVIGKDKVFDVARSPPINEAEVRMPFLYLLRKYPVKGIKNIPKFFYNGLRTKIIKKLYGFAPFDFHTGYFKAIHINPSQ